MDQIDRPKRKLDSVPPQPRPGRSVPDAAFDLWLQRGLHQMFDEVAREPIPEELLRLIEQDRTKK